LDGEPLIGESRTEIGKKILQIEILRFTPIFFLHQNKQFQNDRKFFSAPIPVLAPYYQGTR
jgi:hypothetical protein